MNIPLAEQILPFFDPSKRHLTTEETFAALHQKLVPFPEVIRSLNDPQDNDTFVLLSFLKSSNDSYVKVRGFGNLDSCKEKAKTIMKTVDSRLPIAIARLGQWCYVTEKPDELSKETVKLIDGKEITHKEHVDVLLSEHENKKTDEVIEARNEPDVDEENTLLLYIRFKVMLYETYKQIQFLNMKLDLLKRRQVLINALNKNLSEKYENLWYDEYTSQLSKVGIKSTKITPEKLTEIEMLTDLPEDDIDFKKELKKNETNYNNLRYAAVDF